MKKIISITKLKKSNLLGVFLLIFSVFYLFSTSTVNAATGVNKQINFQGKVTNTDGTNVANNSYNFVFSIYDVSSGGAAIWTESKSIAVTDGIFQTNLGDATALPSSVDFNTDNIFLGINFNSNGEMTPRVQFTASPYAFNSLKLNGNDWASPAAIGTTTAAAGTFTNLSTTTGGLSIAANQSYTGAGAVTLSSTTNGLTLDSGNNTLTVATSDTTLAASGLTTLMVGAGAMFTNASGNLVFQPAGSGTVASVKIGAGGAGSATPDFLGLDVKSTTGDPAGGYEGAMYYNTFDNVFRCYQDTAWTNCIGTASGSQTPWTSDVSAASFNLTSLSNLGFGETTGAPTATDVGFYRDNNGDLTSNVLTGKTLNLSVNGTDEYNFSSTGLALNSNNITGLGTNLTAAGALTIASGAASGLTINSGTTGAINIGDDASNGTINIGTGAAVKTLLIGSLNTTSGVTIQSGSSGINLQANGVATGGVQIGTGSASTTPDLLGLDIKSDAGDPAGTVGDMYYNNNAGKFRCYQGTAWTDCIGAGGSATPAGADTQIQFNNAGTFGADSGLTFNAATQTLGINGPDGGILLNGITNEPTPPASGDMRLYAKSIAGRMMPKFVGSSGLDSVVQPMVAMNKVAWWNPPGNATTAPGVLGMGAMTVVSNGGTTMTTRAVASTRMFTRLKRAGVVSTTTAGTFGSLRQGVAQYTIGDGAGLGGFTYVSRFGTSDAATVTGARQFVGMSSSTAAPTNVEPSTLTNSVGVCKLSTDTTLYLCYGGSAAQTPISLGANFPADTLSTDMYELILYSPTNVNNVVNYRVTRLNTGDVASGTLTATTPGTQLPASTTFMGARFWRTNNATALAVGLDVASLYIETDY